MNKPSFLKKIANDYVVLNFTVMTVITGLLAIMWFIKMEENAWLIYVYVAVMVMSFIGLVVRNKILNDLFLNGIVIDAEIQSMNLWTKAPSIKLQYVVEGEVIVKRITNNRSSYLKSLEVGDVVPILIDPLHPRRVILKEAYGMM